MLHIEGGWFSSIFMEME